MEPRFDKLQFNQSHRKEQQAAHVAKGQKLVIYAVILNIFVVGIAIVAPATGVSQQVGTLLFIFTWCARLAVLALGIYGVLKIGSGLDWSGAAKVFISILLLVPFINLVTLLVVNGRATTFLKNAGYKVGLTGAHKRPLV